MGYWTDGGKRIGVLGLGRSGRAAAALLRDRGFEVVGLDSGDSVDGCEHCGEFVTGDERILEVVTGLDGLVVSPGVDPSSPVPVAAETAGIPVIGEVELAFRNSGVPVLAVTGSNGKTTTTEWLAYLMAEAGMDAVAAGNMGYPYSRAVLERPDASWMVLEVSSYQLQTIERFRPAAAAILNVTPDHLSRHGGMEGYLEAKARIFMNQNGDDVLVLNMDDPGSIPLRDRTSGLEWFFSLEKPVDCGVFLEGEDILFKCNGTVTPVMKTGEVPLPGRHNLANALAVTALAGAAGLEPESMVRGLSTFSGVPHRIRRVRVFEGVSWVNDSKSTNPDSLKVALESFTEPLILIAGGLAKEADYGLLEPLVRKKVKALVLVGDAAGMLADAWKGAADTWVEKDMEGAVSRARRLSRPGDVVLLSPGCASFDQYGNFEERGEHFVRLVEALK